MKLFKSVLAAGAALMMAVTGMTMGASAEEKAWTLHYNTAYPTNANRYQDKMEFFYNGSAINYYSDYLNHFNYTVNPNGSVPYVYFYGFVINQDGSGYDGVDFDYLYYYANNSSDNNSSIYRLHSSCPYHLSHSILQGKKLVVWHHLYNVTKKVQITGKGVV